jgi:hypothetical protein
MFAVDMVVAHVVATAQHVLHVNVNNLEVVL